MFTSPRRRNLPGLCRCLSHLIVLPLPRTALTQLFAAPLASALFFCFLHTPSVVFLVFASFILLAMALAWLGIHHETEVEWRDGFSGMSAPLVREEAIGAAGRVGINGLGARTGVADGGEPPVNTQTTAR